VQPVSCALSCFLKLLLDVMKAAVMELLL